MTLSWLSIGISLVHHVGWTLVHFVWQATFIALLASFLRRCLYRASARVRYLTLCVMLIAMAASPVVTFSRLPPITAAMTQSERMMTVAPQASSRSEVDDPLNVPGADFDVKPVGDAAIGFDPLLDPRVQSPKVGSNTSAKKASWSEECRQILEPFLPWLVAGWITGVLFLSLRLLIGWRLVQRLRRQAIRSVGGGWQERLKVLADRLCVRLPVTLFESELVEVPTVIGWLQPTILLPVSFMTGLTIEQVESVLAHELAHVRRHDYLVNLIQTSVEVLLFYHPAVWWLSKNIREERELCCDDIAVTVCGSRMVYATALATIEEFRSSNSRHSSELAMASDGGSLLYRIRRLALPKPNEAEWFPWFSVSLTLVAVFVAIGLTGFASSPQLRNMDSKISPQLPAEQNDVTAAGSAEANAQAAQETGIHNDALLMRIDSVIEAGRRRTLTANRHSPWQIFQGLFAFQRDFQLSLEGRPVNALEWIANSQPTFDHEPWISKTQSGARFHQYTRPYAFQGHPGQFLSILAEADVPREFMFATSGGPVTLEDVIRDTQKEVNTREELTWVLWGLQHYLPLDARWTSQSHDEWSLEKLVEIEASAPVNGAPNGGNDRLIALTRARDKAIQSGRPLIGGWARADERIKRHLDLARQLQNADGSLSSRFYEIESLATVSTQRMATTGLTLDFLAIALPDQRLSESWVERSVNSLLDEFDKAQHQQLPVETLYRSLHALMSYRDRLSRKKLIDKSIAQAGDTSPAADPASMGLQLRITPLQGSTDDNSPELKNTTTTFAKSDELTFAIELKNVSDRPLTVLGVRYGESYANAAGKLNAEFFAPYLFKFEFLDAAGKPIPRASRTPERDMMILSGASAHELAPKASFVEVLRPGRFRAPLDYQLPPGDYRLRVKYQGPSKETVDSIKKHWPDHPQGNAWRGEVTSNEVAFSISRAPENVKPVDLVWGKVAFKSFIIYFIV